MIKLVIFDFDGTIVDTREIIFEIVDRVMKEHGYSLPRNFKKEMGRKNIPDTLIDLGVKKEDMKGIGGTIVKDFIACKDKIELIKNVKEIKKIKQEKIIVSNNDENFVKALLKNLDLEIFEEVFSPKEFKDKTVAIKNILKERKLNPSEVIYVGDRDSDVEHANEANIVSVAVSNKASWSSTEDLLKENPDFIISNLGELKEIVEKI